MNMLGIHTHEVAGQGQTCMSQSVMTLSHASDMGQTDAYVVAIFCHLGGSVYYQSKSKRSLN